MIYEDKEDLAKALLDILTENYPDATSVKVFASIDEITMTPEYNSQSESYSMRRLDGKWIRRKKPMN